LIANVAVWNEIRMRLTSLEKKKKGKKKEKKRKAFTRH